MNNELEKFVRVNRDAFDTETPPERVWKTLEKKFVKQQAEKAVFYRSIILKISAAAAVVLAACLTTWYFTVTSLDSRDKTLAANTKITNPTGTPGPKAGKQPIPGDSVTAVTAGDKKKNNSGDEAADNNYNQELYYYAKLSEIKFNQLKKLTTDEPELYKS
ncbi:MAG TPA: hypothetical protein VHB48_06415, partial [Chitinophagaceae bacterium]|nr:hypothetical protein [Chitinophagaceae bacterium]